jgi:hypothetical protein
MALAATLMLLPVIAYVLAALWTHALEPRYYLSWTIGLSILLPFTITRFAHNGTRVVSALAIVLLISFGARQALSARRLTQPPPDLQSVYPLLLNGTTGNLPIVISHAHVYLVAAFYAGPGLQRRLIFTRRGVAENDTNTARRAFRALGRWMPLQVVDVDAFISRENRFYVYGPATPLLDLLQNLGAVLVFRGKDPDNQLYAPSRPGPNYLFEVSLERVDPSVR